jgi:hypothetical protein
MSRKAKAKTPVVVPPKDHMLENMAALNRRMDSVEEIVGSLADSDDRLRASMRAKIGKSRRRAQVFMAVNGIRDTNGIAKLVRMQRQNVHIELLAIAKRRLIDIAEENGRGAIYRKRSIDRFTGLSDDLMEKFDLDKNGRELK